VQQDTVAWKKIRRRWSLHTTALREEGEGGEEDEEQPQRWQQVRGALLHGVHGALNGWTHGGRASRSSGVVIVAICPGPG